ncbi:MAG TPA: glucokinase [Allosphingosinicella sp.]
MTEVVAVDIGGTHARFAIASVEAGRVRELGAVCTLKTADYPGLHDAWEAFSASLERPLPKAAAIAVAGPVQGMALKLTNSEWVIQPTSIRATLGAERHSLVNDFGAVAHAVAQLAPQHFRHLCGPDRPLPEDGVISIVGPGTGLGVAQLLCRDGRYHAIATEGGHLDFAPVDSLDDKILQHLRGKFKRVSVERIASGRGLMNIYEALASLERKEIRFQDEQSLWAAALAQEDDLAAASLDRFCLTLGSVAGDIALAQGAQAVVIAGGVGLRLIDHLPNSGFESRFTAKGRFGSTMTEMPVKIISHAQPGLYGAAAAFAQQFGE